MLNCKPKIIVYVSCISIFGIVYASIYTIHDVFVYRVPNSDPFVTSLSALEPLALRSLSNRRYGVIFPFPHHEIIDMARNIGGAFLRFFISDFCCR